MITVTYKGPVFNDGALSLAQVLDSGGCYAFYGSASKYSEAPSVKGVFFVCGGTLVHLSDEPWWWTTLDDKDCDNWSFLVHHMVDLSITATEV